MQKVNSSDKWKIGDKIASRYEIYKIFGGECKSGMGIVYLCYDHEHKIPVALKTFQEQYLFSEEAVKFFEGEALIWARLERYPYIVRALYVERLEGRLFIVLEYIATDSQGRNNLTHYLGNLSYPEILKLSIQFCYGMEYVYSKGVDCHRDIKPDNIMISPDKTVKITDFGLAKAFQEIQPKEDIISSGKTPGLSIFQTKGEKKACGTLPYMAPEQFDGYADKRSDIYSFGIVLYQMAANGQVPFMGRIPEEYEILHKDAKIPLISSYLFPVIQRCLEKYPDKRFQDFISMSEEFQRLLFKETGEKIIPHERTDLDAVEWSNKGFALNNLGRFEEAIICFDEAIKLSQRYATAWHNKGAALGHLGKYKEAITCYNEATRLSAGDTDIWYDKGVILINLGRFQEAAVCCDEAIKLSPRRVEAWNNKGIALANLDRYQEAIICFDEAIRLNSRYAGAWNNKGIALKYLGRHGEAATCFLNASFESLQ